LRLLLRDIRDIDRQLGDKTAQRSEVWRTRALSSKAFKQAEFDYLKEELSELRRRHAANEAGIYDPDDPRHLLLRLREAIDSGGSTHRPRSLLPMRVRDVLPVLDSYFEHSGVPHVQKTGLPDSDLGKDGGG